MGVVVAAEVVEVVEAMKEEGEGFGRLEEGEDGEGGRI